MPFPSPYLNRWYEYIKEVTTDGQGEATMWIRNQGEEVKDFPFPLLPNDKSTPIFFNPGFRITQFYTTVFWSNWIDKIIRDISGPELYKNYTKTYPCPKEDDPNTPYRQHHYAFNFLWKVFKREYGLPIPVEVKLDSIKKYKDVFWGDVQAWLGSIGGEEIRDKAIKAFRGYDFPRLEDISLGVDVIKKAFKD